ncbi:myb-like DNA-binding domain-containing protein [Coniochaeta sp. 2T2.1]|nr:myb-like DNA-binding domain-containing protein [Coniochaeta sp. 2T2.1]
MMASIEHQRRGPWSHREDGLLMRLVATQGALNWVRISQQLGTRTPKQCRERYHQNLKPNLNHEPISPEEGLVIEQLVREIGKRWAEIARRLNNRSDNAVKNWWNGNQNRRKRMDRRKTTIPLQAARYEDRGDMSPLSNSRLAMSVPRTMDRMVSSAVRQLPPPIMSIGFYDRNYGVETPLPSPSVHSPDTASDAGSHYATSPGQYTMASPVSRLPPLLNTQPTYHQPLPLPSASPMENRLPPLKMNSYHYHQEASYRTMQPPPAEYPSPRLTAPNSPVGYAEQQQQPPPYYGAQPVEKDNSRISVANLLG